MTSDELAGSIGGEAWFVEIESYSLHGSSLRMMLHDGDISTRWVILLYSVTEIVWRFTRDPSRLLVQSDDSGPDRRIWIRSECGNISFRFDDARVLGSWWTLHGRPAD